MSPYYIFEDVYISMGTSNFNAIDDLILIILMLFVIFFLDRCQSGPIKSLLLVIIGWLVGWLVTRFSQKRL